MIMKKYVKEVWVKFDSRNDYSENEEKLFELIKIAFMQKRKTLVNALTNSNKYGSKETVEKVIEKMGLDLKIRPEKLTLEQYAELSEEINK